MRTKLMPKKKIISFIVIVMVAFCWGLMPQTVSAKTSPNVVTKTTKYTVALSNGNTGVVTNSHFKKGQKVKVVSISKSNKKAKALAAAKQRGWSNSKIKKALKKGTKAAPLNGNYQVYKVTVKKAVAYIYKPIKKSSPKPVEKETGEVTVVSNMDADVAVILCDSNGDREVVSTGEIETLEADTYRIIDYNLSMEAMARVASVSASEDTIKVQKNERTVINITCQSVQSSSKSSYDVDEYIDIQTTPNNLEIEIIE